MDEILYELRDYSAGLNCGRWDYIFSIIKKLGSRPGTALPDRGQLTMTRHNMRSYSLLAIKTCHRRAVHAIGGMAAYIPVKDDAGASELALRKVTEDKEREVADGHDGTWVAHPGLVALARKCFDQGMPTPNQIERKLPEVEITRGDLLALPEGTISDKGVRHNIDVAVRYLATWLCGNGCVPLYHLMEDAATAEISRSQLWQWANARGLGLDDGRPITTKLMRELFAQVIAALRSEVGAQRFEAERYSEAAKLIEDLVFKPEFTEFMTLVGYERLEG